MLLLPGVKCKRSKDINLSHLQPERHCLLLLSSAFYPKEVVGIIIRGEKKQPSFITIIGCYCHPEEMHHLPHKKCYKALHFSPF